MEDTLRVWKENGENWCLLTVLILILMEDTLRAIGIEYIIGYDEES